MHPRFGVEREYAVRVLGTLDSQDKAELLAGVDVDGQKASFKSIEDGGGDGANRWYRVVITEGRNREVRRLFEAVDLTVSRLIRIRYGSFVLPLGLKRGVWVDLEDGDVRTIRRLAAGDGGQRNERGQGDRNERGNERGQERNPPRGGDRQNGPQPNRNDRQQGPRPNGNPNQNDRNRNAPQRPRVNEQATPRDDANANVERDRDRDSDHDMDFDPASIPNPMEQTFDKRFVQNPRSPAGAHAVRYIELAHDLAHLVAVFAFDAARDAAGARTVGHQHQEASGQADEGGECRALGAALFLLDLHQQFLAFADQFADVHAPALRRTLEVFLGDFLERQETVARGAIIDETGFQRLLDARDARLVDIGLLLFLGGDLDR